MEVLLRVSFILLLWVPTQASSLDSALVLFEPESELFCALYNPTWTKSLKLPNKPSSLVALQTLDEPPGCGWEDYDTSGLSGRIAVTNVGNCSVLQKALIAQRANATSLIVLSKDYIFSLDDISSSLEIGVFVMEEDLMDHIHIDSSKAVVFAPLLGYDAGFAVLWVIAVTLVAVGAFWAQHSRKREVRIEYSKKWQCLQYLWPFVIVAMTAALLVLLYFFYSIAVWFVVGLYCLGSLVGLYQIFSLFSHVQCLQCRLPENDLPLLRRRPTIVSLVSLVAAFGIVVTWLVYYIVRPQQYSHLWPMEDILGIAIILNLIREIRVKSFKMVTILLILFMCYDIFMVFITPLWTSNHKSVMEQVAAGGKVNSGEDKRTLPLLIKVPQINSDDLSVCGWHEHMLGFGDIAIPALLVSYCLAFDRAVNIKQTWRGYYISSLLAYGAGLLVALVVTVVTNDAQPALTYLVPCTLLMVVVVGWRRGELRQLWKGINMGVFDTVPVTREGDNPFHHEHMTSSDEEEVDFDKAELIRTSAV